MFLTRSSKIFIGNNDVASQISDLKIVFKRLGFETITVTDRENLPYIRGEVDYNFTDYKKWWFGGVRPRPLQKWLQELQHIEYRVWRKAIKECDVFIFFWSSFKTDFSDYLTLKKLGKKVIVCHVGDDVRWYPAMKQEFAGYSMRPIGYDTYDHSLEGLERKLIRLRMAEKYADFIFSRVDQSQLALKPYYRFNMMVDVSLILEKPLHRERNPVVVHAPTSRAFKGSEFVLEAIKKLQNENVEFTPILIENMSNKKAMEIYSDSDIIIDQVLCPGSGKLATEGMAKGKAVMAHMAYDRYPQKNPNDCPIVDINPDTVYEKLKELILNNDLRKNIAGKGRSYANKYLDLKLFGLKIIDLVNNNPIEPDYFPDFFRKNFIPESADAVNVYNSWTNFVKKDDWYSSCIESGKREGLIF